MKKILAIALVSALGLSLAACGSSSGSGASEAEDTASADVVESEEGTETASESAGDANSITLWTYPIGNWGDETTVNELTAGFTEETGITVNVEYLNYDDGDDKVNTALTANQGPDVIMEGPERLVANWGAGGYMVDLSDIIDDDDANEIYESVMVPCTSTDGAVYEYPLVMTAHCMAVNYTAFVEAGADQYLDLDSHTWTTDDFIAAMQTMYDYYGDTIGSVYCGGQGGDQGTRALINNLYGGTFTNAEHTEYIWEDEANIEALQQLMGMDSMNFDSAIVGADEIALFYQGILKVAFCWNIAQQLDPNSAGTGAGLTMDGDEIVFMSFPSESGTSELCGGIWGFGIFDNGDADRIEASKEFIKYMCDSEHTEDAVIAANYFAVRDSVDGTDISTIWADNDIMDEYGVLMQYMGDYYQVTPGWAEARTAWWNMLQQIGQGGDITETVAQFNAEANAAAAQ